MRYRVYGRFNDNYFEGSKEECYEYIDMRLSEPWNGSFDFEEYRIKAVGGGSMNYTREQLLDMPLEQLKDLCWAQRNMIDSVRGYNAGFKREFFDVFDRESLVECYLENRKNFGETT